jgi:hypothetical protein
MTRTPYGFLTGLLSTMAVDWSGAGPTFRRWRAATTRGYFWHGIGQFMGFLLIIGLMSMAVLLSITDHDGYGMCTALTLLCCVIGANVIAARLP